MDRKASLIDWLLNRFHVSFFKIKNTKPKQFSRVVAKFDITNNSETEEVTYHSQNLLHVKAKILWFLSVKSWFKGRCPLKFYLGLLSAYKLTYIFLMETGIILENAIWNRLYRRFVQISTSHLEKVFSIVFKDTL